MFDIGFLELGLIAVVALVVIGPERLPGVAGKADTLKRLLEEQTNLQSVHEIIETTVSGEDSRKPVPRAKSDYLVKAVPNESADESTDEPSDEDSKKQSADQKHV